MFSCQQKDYKTYKEAEPYGSFIGKKKKKKRTGQNLPPRKPRNWNYSSWIFNQLSLIHLMGKRNDGQRTKKSGKQCVNTVGISIKIEMIKRSQRKILKFKTTDSS